VGLDRWMFVGTYDRNEEILFLIRWVACERTQIPARVSREHFDDINDARLGITSKSISWWSVNIERSFGAQTV
jgi:hypothetical protein